MPRSVIVVYFIVKSSVAPAKVRIIFQMARTSSENRRPSTIIRDNSVHEVYDSVIADLGEYAYLVPKSYIYDKIHERTELCHKTIAYVLNRTRKTNL